MGKDSLNPTRCNVEEVEDATDEPKWETCRLLSPSEYRRLQREQLRHVLADLGWIPSDSPWPVGGDECPGESSGSLETPGTRFVVIREQAKEQPSWYANLLKPLWLWDKCCGELGVDSRLVRPYFLPIDEAPDWYDRSNCAIGAANWDDGYNPEVVLELIDNLPIWFKMVDLRHTICHELIHIIMHEAEEEEVARLALTITRRREGYEEHKLALRIQAYDCRLGPVQESWTLFQWARAQRKKEMFCIDSSKRGLRADV